MEPEFREALITPVQWSRYEGEDNFGNNVYTDPVTLMCRVDTVDIGRGGGPVREELRGDTIMTTAMIFDITDPLIHVRDHIVYMGEEMNVVQVTHVYDERELHHQVVNVTEGSED